MMNRNNLLLGALLLGMSFTIVSCDKKDDYDFSKDKDLINNNGTSSSSSSSTSNKVSLPVFKSTSTTTTTQDVNFSCTFETGGDSKSNMSCKVYWAQYSKKPSSEPTISQLSKVETMREYATSSSKSIVFKKSHSGFSGGTWIYYAFECRNSKGSTKTSVLHTIVKR